MASTPVTSSDVRIEQLETVFGTRGDAARCWCQFFRLPNAEYRVAGTAELKGRTTADLTGPGPSPGVVATVDGQAVGWCAVAPWSAYPRLRTSPSSGSALVEPGDDRDGVWAVTCFVVRVGHRRKGVATALLRAAVEHARNHGARVVEAYPVDATQRAVSSAELYHGSLEMFLDAGFEVTARTSPRRAVVRLALPA